LGSVILGWVKQVYRSLYKLLVRDLSMGGVIRQQRQTDYAGNFVKKQSPHVSKGQASRTMASAFENSEGYELTDLGRQFVHYAMTEIVARIAFSEAEGEPTGNDAATPQA
jgi:hypothetical protein